MSFAHSLVLALVTFGGGLLLGVVHRTTEPEPAPSEDERDPDYCFTHNEIEREDER
jgi:hypothetical protein